jgi:hypothetical protein
VVTLKLPPEYREIADVLDAICTDDPPPEAMAQFKKWLDESPDLWAIAGDITKMVRDKIVERLSGNEIVRESLTKAMEVMRAEMGYEAVSQPERLLIDQVTLCWLRLRYVEWHYTRVTSESIPIARADYWERRLNAAQRRFLRACETLTRVRKITRQTLALQVNIAAKGGQQVNVLGDVKREG